MTKAEITLVPVRSDQGDLAWEIHRNGVVILHGQQQRRHCRHRWKWLAENHLKQATRIAEILRRIKRNTE